jgi:Xaa-Pro dipeptidase
MDARKERVARVAAELKRRGYGAVLFEDTEGRRDPTVRYLTGQPGDAIVVVSSDGACFLTAWDVNMARKHGLADRIDAYGDYGRNPRKAVKAHLATLGVAPGAVVCLPAVTSYPDYLKYVEELEDWDLACEEEGIGSFVEEMRAVKDESEIAIYREAASITDALVDALERDARSGLVKSEMDAALFIERECRALGCEGTGFETLSAGPTRSFGIHAFPPYGSGEFATKGTSILDFGVKYEGYTTDVTMTFVREPSPLAEKMVALVERAYAETVALCAPGAAVRTIAARADAIFAEAGMVMPHSLGHGVGLEAHEFPLIRDREDIRATLKPGMIVTIEPGLYDPEAGGVRLENDVLVTDKGHEVITRCRIVRL